MATGNYPPAWRRVADGNIDFGVGQPGRTLLPLEILKKATEERFSSFPEFDERHMLQYGESQGEFNFREAIANFLTPRFGVAVHKDGVMVTNGVSQGLDLICAALLQTGDVVVMEEPTYFLAMQIFKDYGAQIVPVPVDAEGLNVDALESILASHRVGFLYTIPTHGNPSSVTLSASRRERLVDLARKHSFTVIADEVYQLLTFKDAPAPPPCMRSFDKEGDSVISVSSFSKILCPGLRLGWVHSSLNNIGKLLARGYLYSGGGLSPFTGGLVHRTLENGGQSEHLSLLQSSLQSRCHALVSALRSHLPSSVASSLVEPQGGYFVWLKLPDTINAKELREKCIKEYGVSFQAGAVFSPSGSHTLDSYVRLCFAYYEEEELVEGAKRLARAVNDALGTSSSA